MAAILGRCPFCGAVYEIAPNQLGQQVECSICKRVFVLQPESEKAPAPLKIVAGPDAQSEKKEEKTPQPSRKTLLTGIVVGVLFLSLIAAAAIYLYNVFFGGAQLAQYAPKGTNVIVYANFQKITNHKLFKKWEKIFKSDRKELQRELKKSGLDYDEAKNSELCLFINTDNLQSHEEYYTALLKFNGDAALDVFEALAKELQKEFGKNVDDDDIHGKPAIVAELPNKKICIIQLEKNVLQISPGCKSCIDKPLKKQALPLAEKVNQRALISIACDLTNVDFSREFRKWHQQLDERELDSVMMDIEFITLNVLDQGDEIAAELVVSYKKESSAKTSEKKLKEAFSGFEDELRKEFNGTLNKTFKKIRIECKGSDLVITYKEDVEELERLLKKMK